MGASASTPASRELVEACSALNVRDIAELAALFRKAHSGLPLAYTRTTNNNSLSNTKKRFALARSLSSQARLA